MDKITKLSTAIRLGSTFLEETDLFFKFRGGKVCAACAIGTAGIASGFDPEHNSSSEALRQHVATRFNMDPYEVMLISNRHFRGEATRAQIADELEAKGL